jgi:hypothetical protein
MRPGGGDSALRAGVDRDPVTSASVLSPTPRAVRVAGLLAAGAAAVALAAAGCTSVTGGDAAANSAEAPAYRTSVSLSSSQSASASSSRESERQAAMTTRAVHDTCETLSTTSADAIDAVNDYVKAYNDDSAQIDATFGPAVDALNQSAEAVQASITDIVPDEMKDVFYKWIDGAISTAEAISSRAAAAEFNKAVDDLNQARTDALRLCDATY